MVVACQPSEWSETEREIINGQGEIMRVLTVCNETDSLVLRSKCSPISNRSEERR